MENKIIEVGNYSPSNHDASRIVADEGIAPTARENHGTVTAILEGGQRMKLDCKQAGQLTGGQYSRFESLGRVYSPDGASPTMLTMQGGNREPKIVEPQAMRLERTEEGKELKPREDGILNTLTTVDKDNYTACPANDTKPNFRIRKLTPKECFRLMGVKDEDSANMARNQSKSSQFHLAGDSICTTCLMAIFGEMLDMDWENKIQDVVEDITKETK